LTIDNEPRTLCLDHETRIDRVSEGGAGPDNGEDIGDIDVLVVDPERHTLLVIDAKAFVPNLTASEIAAELHDTFRPGQTGKRSSADHLHERVAWVEAHINNVLSDLDLDDDDWVAKPLFVLDRELVSPHFDQLPIPSIALKQLEISLSAGGNGLDLARGTRVIRQRRRSTRSKKRRKHGRG
jgi:hypothetical protein